MTRSNSQAVLTDHSELFGLPPYPHGVVVGPCVCGSWPGGKCFKCPVIPPTAAPVASPEPTDHVFHPPESFGKMPEAASGGTAK